MTRVKIRDRDGEQIRVGDKVRVVGVPDLANMGRIGRRECAPAFEHIRGTYRRVVGFNEIGWVELELRILRGPHAGMHWVWIEPELLKRRQRR